MPKVCQTLEHNAIRATFAREGPTPVPQLMELLVTFVQLVAIALLEVINHSLARLGHTAIQLEQQMIKTVALVIRAIIV